jgi:hypothetical protein
MADPFDDVLLLEQRAAELGRAEGIKQGRLSGEADGRRIGLERGSHLGTEVRCFQPRTALIISPATGSARTQQGSQHP